MQGLQACSLMSMNQRLKQPNKTLFLTKISIPVILTFAGMTGVRR